MNQAIKIRRAKVSDVPGILQVRKATWLSTYPNKKYGISKKLILSMNFTGPARVVKEQKKIKKKNLLILVAEISGQIVGYCQAGKSSKEGSLGAIYILPEFQHKGIGTKMFESIFRWLGKVRPVALKAAKYNTKAIKFYKKLGFTITNPDVFGPKLPDGRKFPSVEMRRM